MRVLLTGARAPVTLDLARRFHKHGVEVFLADSLRFALAGSSRAVSRTFCVPRPVASPLRYVQALAEIVDTRKIDLLLPTCEEIFYVSHFADQFPGHCRIFADAIEKLRVIHNKWTFAQKADNCGVYIPETTQLNGPECLGPLLHESESWVFKPVYSRFAAETKIGPARKTAATIRPSASRPWIAQRRIRGTEYSTYSIAHEGRLLAHASYVSRYRAGQASGIFFVNRPHAAIKLFVSRFVEKENFTGQIGFDFLVDGEDRPWVLEANPRATSGLHLFAAEDELVPAILGQRDNCVCASESVPRMVSFAMPLWGLVQAIRRGSMWSFARDCLRARDVVFDWRDPLPLVRLPLTTAELLAICLRERRKMTSAATYDIEWNGEPL